jgi:hypothetical protein
MSHKGQPSVALIPRHQNPLLSMSIRQELLIRGTIQTRIDRTLHLMPQATKKIHGDLPDILVTQEAHEV